MNTDNEKGKLILEFDFAGKIFAEEEEEEEEEEVVVISLKDITERKKAEEERSKIESTLRSLNTAALAVQRAMDTEDVFRAVAIELEKFGFHTTIFLIDEEQRNLSIEHLSFSPKLIKAAEKLTGLRLSNVSFPLDRIPQYKEVLTNRVPVFSQVSERIEGFLPDHLKGITGKLIKLLGLQRAIIAPLVVEGKVIGALSVDSKELTESDVPTITAFANQVSIAIENARLYEAAQQELAERKKVEGALRESQERYKSLIESTEDPIYLISRDLRYLHGNAKLLSRLGVSTDEIVGKEYNEFHSSESTKEFFEKIEEVCVSGKSLVYEHKSLRDGRYFLRTLSPVIKPITGELTAITVVSKDITKRKQAEEQIQASLKEKEILLREIHHRVKNNLQIMASLLALQSDHLRDEQVIEMLKISQHRIRSMALIHEKLYQSEDLRRIDFKYYIEDLVRDLCQTYHIDSTRIVQKIEVKDVLIGINTAIPCGLIINELVSNSLKHAFPTPVKDTDQLLSEIKITIDKTDENEIEMVISDNGVGLPEDVDFRRTETLGLHLVRMLAEDQLKGKIELDRTAGTTFQIKFSEKE